MSIKMDTKEFAGLLSMIDKKGEDIVKAADEALTVATDTIAENLTTAASPYAGRGLRGYATGRMYGTIIQGARPEWQGNVATIRAGFKVRDALESVFIMYGTYGTPRHKPIAADKKVYNAIMGTKTRKEIQKRQEEILQKYLGLED